MSFRKTLHNRLYVAAIAAAILLALPGCGGGGPGTPAGGFGNVSGRVYDIINSANIPGASVTTTGQSTTTAGDGTFVLSGLPSGEVTLTVSKVGYSTKNVSVTVISGGTATVAIPLSDTGPPPPP